MKITKEELLDIICSYISSREAQRILDALGCNIMYNTMYHKGMSYEDILSEIAKKGFIWKPR